MDGMLDPNDPRLTQAWDILKAQKDLGLSLEPESNRLAFADPEFLLRRETRGIRFQLEMLKPDLEMKARGICPVALVLNSVNPILAQGIALADLTLLCGFEVDITTAIQSGMRLRLDPGARSLTVL